MQAVLTNSIVRDSKDELCGLFQELEGADNSLKSIIENKIVEFGDAAIGFLVDKLIGSKGIQRGVAAMSLIRIGEGALEELRNLANSNSNYSWVATYIIREIEGNL